MYYELYVLLCSFCACLCVCTPGDGSGTPMWNRRGCLLENLNLTPKGDHLGVAQAFLTPKVDQSGRGLSKFWPPKRDRLKKGKKKKKENLTSVSLRIILCFFVEP